MSSWLPPVVSDGDGNLKGQGGLVIAYFTPISHRMSLNFVLNPSDLKP